MNECDTRGCTMTPTKTVHVLDVERTLCRSCTAFYQDADYRVTEKSDQIMAVGDHFNSEPHRFMRFASGGDFRHACAECSEPKYSEIHGFDPQDNVPVRVSNSTTASADQVRQCYSRLIDQITEYNEFLERDGHPEDQVHIPFALQQVLADYIAEREAIESLTKKKEDV